MARLDLVTRWPPLQSSKVSETLDFGGNDFKPTELGDLPAEWEVVRLGEVAHLVMGQSPPSSTYNTTGEGMPFLQGKAEFGDVYPIPVKWCSEPLKVAKQNSILISVRAPVGDVNVARSDYIIGRGLAAINGQKCLDNHYLFYLLTLEKERIQKYETGTTFKSINKAVLQNFPIPLPPLDEQRKIARVLNTVQQAIATQADVIAAAQELKRSLLRRLFTYGPGPEPASTKETEIGEVPVHWEVRELGELALIVNSGATPRGGQKVYQTSGIPLIRSQNVLMNRLSMNDVAYISEKIHGEMERSQIRPDDVLLNITGASIGRVAYVPASITEANVNQHVCRIRLDKNIAYPPYITFCLTTSRAQSEIMGTQFGTTRQGLNYGQVKMLRVPLPPLPEQHQIAHILQSADAKIAAEQDRQAALRALFNSLLQELMTGRLRVRANG